MREEDQERKYYRGREHRYYVPGRHQQLCHTAPLGPPTPRVSWSSCIVSFIQGGYHGPTDGSPLPVALIPRLGCSRSLLPSEREYLRWHFYPQPWLGPWECPHLLLSPGPLPIPSITAVQEQWTVADPEIHPAHKGGLQTCSLSSSCFL